jgi:hypothetical protein
MIYAFLLRYEIASVPEINEVDIKRRFSIKL